MTVEEMQLDSRLARVHFYPHNVVGDANSHRSRSSRAPSRRQAAGDQVHAASHPRRPAQARAAGDGRQRWVVCWRLAAEAPKAGAVHGDEDAEALRRELALEAPRLARGLEAQRHVEGGPSSAEAHGLEVGLRPEVGAGGEHHGERLPAALHDEAALAELYDHGGADRRRRHFDFVRTQGHDFRPELNRRYRSGRGSGLHIEHGLPRDHEGGFRHRARHLGRGARGVRTTCKRRVAGQGAD
mmetsp:Transcript_2899/g.8231  ORF Transcript_2899/g.8231 Transcript_2899/m.8231 type:complete len:241 (+) Transcript_2899:716-1438(+)